jgi:hypothetical protein
LGKGCSSKGGALVGRAQEREVYRIGRLQERIVYRAGGKHGGIVDGQDDGE